MKKIALFLICSLALFACKNGSEENSTDSYILKSDTFQLSIDKNNFGFSFSDVQGNILAPAHPLSGLTISGHPIIGSEEIKSSETRQSASRTFLVGTEKGNEAKVMVSLEGGVVAFEVDPINEQLTHISLKMGGMPVAHGLGDAGAYEENFNLVANEIGEYPIANNGGTRRWLSTFTIFPKNSFAGVFLDEGKKSVVLKDNEYAMNITKKGKSTFFYFLGNPATIYKNFKNKRDAYGYTDVKPKSRLFELGWESWDALLWNTSEKTVKPILEKFQQNGYPIRWAVTGSGFWETGGTTTSFGKWNEKFPDPKGFKKWMHSRDIKWMIGLRTNFVPEGGPFYPETEERNRNLKVKSFNGNPLSAEALDNDFFVKDGSGDPLLIASRIFPIVPTFLLDGRKDAAANWFGQQYQNWDLDGIKEDTMMKIDSLTGIYNRPVCQIAEKGGLVMARNGEISSAGTLQRIDDTTMEHLSNRIPVNYLQYAASGYPNVYSDVAGVHNMKNLDDVDRSIRHAWLLSLTAGMSVGAYPENWPSKKQALFKKAVDFHYRFAPYIFSAAMEGYETGYPTTLTPLIIAYPKDSTVANLKNFEWMVGESMLATPLLQNLESGKMDVYLPEGIWFDYDTGKKYQGPTTIENYELPLEKTPCFVGGKGILIERRGERSYARIYPLSKNSETTFTAMDGFTKSSILVKDPDWTDVNIVDTKNGEKITFSKVNDAFEFELSNGHTYSIQ